MKRSEFLKRLRKIGEEKLPYAWDYFEPEEVLDIIESLGMLPPRNKYSYEREVELRLRGYFLDYNMPEIYYHKWEPEE